MADNNEAFAILWYTEVNRIQESILDNIVQPLELVEYIIKVRSITIEKPADILKKPEIRINPANRLNKYREPITGVLGAKLLTADTERLTWRSTYDNLRRRIELINMKPGADTVPGKIIPIGPGVIRFHLVACRVYTAGFKAK